MPSAWSKPARPSGAPALRHRIAFDKRGAASGGTDYGQAQGAFAQQFVVAAALEARFGGEQISAQRLAGRQPFTLTVRQSSETRLIKTDWQAREINPDTDATLATYDIASIADPDDTRRWFDILVLARGEDTA